jgi:hypothetical protein
MCQYSNSLGTDRNGNPYDCGSMYTCCDCGVRGDDEGCGCSYCFSCHACEECLNKDDNQ